MIPATNDIPEHCLMSMVRQSHRPMTIRARLRGDLGGEMHGEILPER